MGRPFKPKAHPLEGFVFSPRGRPYVLPDSAATAASKSSEAPKVQSLANSGNDLAVTSAASAAMSPVPLNGPSDSTPVPTPVLGSTAPTPKVEPAVAPNVSQNSKVKVESIDVKPCSDPSPYRNLPLYPVAQVLEAKGHHQPSKKDKQPNPAQSTAKSAQPTEAKGDHHEPAEAKSTSVELTEARTNSMESSVTPRPYRNLPLYPVAQVLEAKDHHQPSKKDRQPTTAQALPQSTASTEAKSDDVEPTEARNNNMESSVTPRPYRNRPLYPVAQVLEAKGHHQPSKKDRQPTTAQALPKSATSTEANAEPTEAKNNNLQSSEAKSKHFEPAVDPSARQILSATGHHQPSKRVEHPEILEGNAKRARPNSGTYDRVDSSKGIQGASAWDSAGASSCSTEQTLAEEWGPPASFDTKTNGFPAAVQSTGVETAKSHSEASQQDSSPSTSTRAVNSRKEPLKQDIQPLKPAIPVDMSLEIGGLAEPTSSPTTDVVHVHGEVSAKATVSPLAKQAISTHITSAPKTKRGAARVFASPDESTSESSAIDGQPQAGDQAIHTPATGGAIVKQEDPAALGAAKSRQAKTATALRPLKGDAANFQPTGMIPMMPISRPMPTRSCTSLSVAPSPQMLGEGELFQELQGTPLFTWRVKEFAAAASIADGPLTGSAPRTVGYEQYALLGRQASSRIGTPLAADTAPVFLNVNAPWSALICGSQGTGKSSTLSCMLENCLMPRASLGALPKPLSGVLFHYDLRQSKRPCEAASMASHVPVVVLLSPGAFHDRKKVYAQIPGVTVLPLILREHQVSMHRLEQFLTGGEASDTSAVAIVVVRTLRKVAAQRNINIMTSVSLQMIGRLLHEANELTPLDKAYTEMRLMVLQSFLEAKPGSPFKAAETKNDIFLPRAGQLTIVDLTDPMMDACSANLLFNLCLGLFSDGSQGFGQVFVLDDAHKYLTGGASSNLFAESLVDLCREQRHQGARVIISTQEPDVQPQLLDLCSMTIVHRFTSPAWLEVLRAHLPGASEEQDQENARAGLETLFDEIVNLRVGESVLFAPAAMLDVVVAADARGGADGQKLVTKLGRAHLKLQTRERITDNAGGTVVASSGRAPRHRA